MARKLTYPDNWLEIATAVKLAAGYRCSRCNCQCLPPTDSYRHLDVSLRRALSAQVHHLDGNPQHNERANLICVCAPCHLRIHRHHSQPTPGQLSLKLKLPANRRLGKNSGQKRIQLSLDDVIARLPKLAQRAIHQTELDIS
jgi:hypothetical protein